MQGSLIPSAPATPAIQTVLNRYQPAISQALRDAVTDVSELADNINTPILTAYYGQMQYHLGWVDEAFHAVNNHPGKLLRPTLLLLAYEIAIAGKGAPPTPGFLRRALPAAVAVELIHNFTLLHDDIEDADTERRHRPTVWKIWGIPQAINTGDGMIFVARLALWKLLEAGVSSEVILRLSQLLDRTILTITEGQYLDLRFEDVSAVSIDYYTDMIGRKTAALMSCATEMGALLGSDDSALIAALSRFGWLLGLAFQVRDDLLGVWSSSSVSGKSAAGDIYRRKKSLPILHSLSVAHEDDRRTLQSIYQQHIPLTFMQVETVLSILARTDTERYCLQFLLQLCSKAKDVLKSTLCHPDARQSCIDMEAFIDFIAEKRW